ncbi:MAG TPA: NHL repeat-containing protein [Bdellovibrionota bacterium]|nr:NHL repeat-containing protein [Bdellovibrionota bacterium]
MLGGLVRPTATLGAPCVPDDGDRIFGGSVDPSGVAVDTAGNLYVADYAGDQVLGYNSPLTDQTADRMLVGLNDPKGIAFGPDGNLYVVDTKNKQVVRYNSPSFSGPFSVLGSTTHLYWLAIDSLGKFYVSDLKRVFIFDFGSGVTTINVPFAIGGLAVDGAGNLFVSDPKGGRVFEYDSPHVTNQAPNRTITGLNTPIGLTYAGGKLYVADNGDNQIVVYDNPTTNLTPDGFIGAGELHSPDGVAVDGSGNVFVMEEYSNRVLEFDANHVTGASNIQLVSGSPMGGNSATLSWATTAETDLEGFNVAACDNKGTRVQLNPSLIRCEQCITGLGSSYSFIVPDKPAGSTDVFIEVVHQNTTVETFGPAQ